MLKYVLGLLVALSTVAVYDAPQAEARFGSRYASAPGWRPGKFIIRFRHANAERRGLFPGRMTGQASCAVATRPVAASCNCPNCPCGTTKAAVPAAPKDCPDCPNGVCPKG